MASKLGLAGGIPERKVRPIWDAIDSRQYKPALKLSAALLAKYPKSPYALALKALILEKTGKLDEALVVCLESKELLYSNNLNIIHFDDLTLSTLQIVFQRLDRLDLATSCYEHACGKFPNNLEMLMGLFNCYVHEYSFVKQQQRDIAEEQRERIDSLAAKLAEARADFEKALAEKNAELQLLRTQKEAAEEQLQKEREEWARKEKINIEIVEGLKTSIAKKAILSSGQQSKEDIISEYKQSAGFESILKEFGEHGYVLLKKYLEKNHLLTKDQLKKIDYDTCIEDASDKESDNR